MSVEQRIGKIKNVRIGFGGYQDIMFGITFDFGGKGWGVGTFEGTWATRPKDAKWTLADQNEAFLKAFLLLKKTMEDAEVDNAHSLIGKPVMITFEDNMLKSWRILTEAV